MRHPQRPRGLPGVQGGEEGIEPAIVVERYDRLISEAGVARLHQEDFCQALGCMPENKYAINGGPGCTDILRVPMSTRATAQLNAADFLQMLFFNYLLAATDAHAKNYSLMLNADGAHRLAPMYDVASAAPYIDKGEWKAKPPKLAMSIGGENRAGFVTLNNLEKLVEQCNLDAVKITAEGCANLISAYANAIPEKLSEIFDALEDGETAASAKELRARMESPITLLCARAKARL